MTYRGGKAGNEEIPPQLDIESYRMNNNRTSLYGLLRLSVKWFLSIVFAGALVSAVGSVWAGPFDDQIDVSAARSFVEFCMAFPLTTLDERLAPGATRAMLREACEDQFLRNRRAEARLLERLRQQQQEPNTNDRYGDISLRSAMRKVEQCENHYRRYRAEVLHGKTEVPPNRDGWTPPPMTDANIRTFCKGKYLLDLEKKVQLSEQLTKGITKRVYPEAMMPAEKHNASPQVAPKPPRSNRRYTTAELDEMERCYDKYSGLEERIQSVLCEPGE